MVRRKVGKAIDVILEAGSHVQVIKHIWPLMGMDYERERLKQDEIFNALQKHTSSKFRKAALRFWNQLGRVDVDAKREQAVKSLEELAKTAHGYATADKQDAHISAKWARIEAYIWQTLNSILRDIDRAQIKDEIAKLTRMVEDELGKKA